MTVIVKHNKTNTITDWTQAQLDEQIALGNFAPGTTLANIVLPSDWNNDHTLTGVGTMAEQDATAVAITGGTINNTTIGATTATTGKFTSVTTPSVTATTTNLNLYPASTGNVIVNQSSGGAFGAVLAQDIGTSTNSSRLFFATSAGTASIWNGGGDNLTFRTAATIGTSSGTEQMRITNTASAVNYVQVTGAATGGAPAISAQGSDTNSTLSIASKGTGAIRFDTGGATAQFRVLNTASSVNRLDVTGSATGFAVQSALSGTDTNISMAFQPKGTGAIDLAAGSSGVNISNGGTVTAITRTAGGSGYATAPTVAISAPTTAGGVQATATCTVTAGAVDTTFTITNAGSGYIEQPTITFSGGGGSGAAAYAHVGGQTIIRTLASPLSFSVPGGEAFRVSDSGVTSAAYWNVFSGSTSPILRAIGSASGVIQTGSAVPIQFTTNASTSSTEQFRVSHTASAVNYVQVTGAATTSFPIISAQGSDTNISMQLYAKGTGAINFWTSNGGSRHFQVAHTAGTIVNYATVTGSATGAAPAFSVAGTDTDIDLTLTPKGAGNVRFGTYTAGVLTPTGYVTIKDSGGTTRRLLVG